MATVWDQIIRWAPFWANVATILASMATIIAIFFFIKQIRVSNQQTKIAEAALRAELRQIGIAQSALNEDREERKEQRRRQRDTILGSLRAEISAIRTAVDMDLKGFQPSDMSIPQVEKAAHDMRVEHAIGDMAYYRSFVWTSLPTSTIEQALREAELLDLTVIQVEALQNLRLRILRANSFGDAKIALLPALVQISTAAPLGGAFEGDPTQAQPGLEQYYRWVDIKADRLNENIQIEFTGILNGCNKISEWLGD